MVGRRASETFDWVSVAYLGQKRHQYVPFESIAGAFALEEFGFD